MWGHSRCGSQLNSCNLSDIIPTKEEKSMLLQVDQTLDIDENIKAISLVSGS